MTRRLTFDDITLLIAPIIRGDSLGRREAESRAVESLVRQAFGPGAVIVHNADGVPSVEAHGGDHVASLSVSHSRDYACIAFPLAAPSASTSSSHVISCAASLPACCPTER